MFKPPFNWFNKFGTLPATYKEAMSYEEQIMWLCKEVQRNESYAEEFQAVIDEINESIDSINTDLDDVYLHLNNKQDTLTAGNGILLQNNKISTAPTNLSHLLVANGYIDFSNVSVSDVLDLTPVSASNSNYLILATEQGEKIELVGKLDLAIVDPNNQILTLEKNIEASSFDNPAVVDILDNNTKLVVSFYDTNTNSSDVRLFMSSDFIYDEFQRKQDKLIAGNGITLNGDVISASVNTFIDISSLIKTGSYIDLSNKTVGDTVSLEPVSASNTAYFMKEVALGEQFKITGNVTVAEIDNENRIVNIASGTGTSQNPAFYDCIAQLPSRARIIVSFNNTDSNTPSIYDNIDGYYTYNNIEGSKMIRKLKEDLYLVDSSPDTGLIDGLYFSGDYHIYVNGTKNDRYDKALFLVDGSVIYAIASPYNNHSNQAYSELYYNYSNNTWNEGAFGISTDWSLIANKPSINNFTQDLNLVDGTGSTGLADGLYFTGNYHVIVNNAQDYKFDKALILADSNNVLYVIASPSNNHSGQAYYEAYYDSSSATWKNGDFYIATEWSQVANKPAGMENYSTTEQVVGTWINGKPLYQIVYTINSPTASTQYTDIDVTSLNIATLVKMEGLIDLGTDYRQLPMFDRVSNNFYWTDLWYSNNDKLLSVRNTNTSMENKPCNVIIQYTKTTD